MTELITKVIPVEAPDDFWTTFFKACGAACWVARKEHWTMRDGEKFKAMRDNTVYFIRVSTSTEDGGDAKAGWDAQFVKIDFMAGPNHVEQTLYALADETIERYLQIKRGEAEWIKPNPPDIDIEGQDNEEEAASR
jgi:hypothetical protein